MAPAFEPVRKKDYTLADFRKGAEFLLSRTQHRPKVAVVLGSGLSQLVKAVEEPDDISYEDVRAALPYFPTCSVSGHTGNFIFGRLDGVCLLIMQGRFHLYEGHTAQAITYPMRIMKEMGIETLIITNAAGGLSPTLRVGDVMVITDHFNTAWGENHPLIGPNIDAHGQRFIPCSNLYDRDLRALALRVGRERGLLLKQGVYIFTSGPSFETPMEVRLFRFMSERHPHLGPILKTLRLLVGPGLLARALDSLMGSLRIGESAVGMSTVPEVLVANHCGMKVLALSGIPNMCIDDVESVDKVSHEEVKLLMDTLVVPVVLEVVRGVVQHQDEGSDIVIDIDKDDIARWRMPTQLCVPWSTFFAGVSLGVLVVVGVVSPALVYSAWRAAGQTAVSLRKSVTRSR